MDCSIRHPHTSYDDLNRLKSKTIGLWYHAYSLPLPRWGKGLGERGHKTRSHLPGLDLAGVLFVGIVFVVADADQ